MKAIHEALKKQFPYLAHLPLKEVDPQGHDNRSYRLGDGFLVRVPSAECYAPQVQKEQRYLPFFKNFLSLKIPEPLFLGKPEKALPWEWSVYRWIPGEVRKGEMFSEDTARDLALFLRELHQVPIEGAPLGGRENFYRGAHPSVYSKDVFQGLGKFQNLINVKKARSLWELACVTHWDKNLCWVHGDLAEGNLLFLKEKLDAVIDFGCAAVGDPACDLAPAWTLFDEKGRQVFMDELGIEENTWLRARAWVLWKALVSLHAQPEESGDFQKFLGWILTVTEDFDY